MTLPRLAWISCFLLLLASAAFLRFVNLGENGLNGSDNAYYTSIAKSWSEGKPVLSIGFHNRALPRQAVFFSYGLAIRVLGYHDSSIKRFNAALDLTSVLLLLAIAYSITGDAWCALATGISYGLLPMAIRLSRTEMVHSLSTLLALASFLLWFRARRSPPGPWRYFQLASAGAATALAALTHEDLAFLFVGFALCIVWLPNREVERTPRAIGLELGSFSVPFFFVSQPLIEHKLVDLLLLSGAVPTTRKPESLSHGPLLEEMGRTIWNGVSGNTSMTFLALCLLLSLVVALSRFFCPFAHPWSPYLQSVWVLITSYFICFNFLLNFGFVRLFLPMTVFFLLAFFLAAGILLDRLRWPGRRLAFLALAGLVVVANLAHFGGWSDRQTKSYFHQWASWKETRELGPRRGLTKLRWIIEQKSWVRQRIEEAEGMIGPEARVLVTPSSAYPFPGRRWFQMGYYWGDDAVYLLDHRGEELDDLVARKRIRFVLFDMEGLCEDLASRTHFNRYRYHGIWEFADLDLRAGPHRELAYSERAEYEQILEFLRRREAVPLFVNGARAPLPADLPHFEGLRSVLFLLPETP